MAVSRHILAVVLCFATAGMAAAAEKPSPSRALILETRPPAGFEALTGPQELLLEVFFAGRSIGFFPVISQPARLRLLSPEAVLAAVPNLEPARYPVVLGVLSGELASNSALSCSIHRRQDCGQLEPPVAGVIFDESRLRLDLFLAPDTQTMPRASGPQHLPGPTAQGFGFFNPLSAYVSRGFSDQDRDDRLLDYTIQSDSYLSRGPLSFHLASSYGNELSLGNSDREDPGFAINEASGLLVRPGWRHEGGLFRSTPMPVIGTRRIAGFSTSTTTLTRTDITGARGSPLTVFLPARSVVDLVVNGRIVSRQTYSAGNQLLDTSALPDGGYQVEIVVHDPSGGERRQTQFFAKSVQVPPADQPVYIAEFGAIARDDREELLGVGSDPFYRLGTVHRLGSALALGGDLIGGRDLTAASVTGTLFTGFGMMTLTGLRASDHSVGLGLSAYGEIPGTAISYSLFGQRLRREVEPSPLVVYDGTDILGGSFDQLSLSFSTPLGKHATLGFLGGYREDRISKATWNAGPRITLDLSRWLNLNLLLDAGVTATDQDTVALLQFRLFESFGERNRWSNASTLGALAVLKERNEISRYAGSYNPVAASELQWSDGDLWAPDVRAHGGLRYQDDRDLDLFVGGNYEGQKLALDGDLAYTRGHGRNVNGGYAATASAMTALAWSGGKLAAGQGKGGEASIIVALSGDAPGALYDVLVNGYPVARLSGSGTTSIPLPPFATYEIRLKPLGAAMIDIDSRARQVTLYPGNVVTLDWSVAYTMVAFGRVLRAGQPLAHARMKGARGIAITDADGYFQIDVAAGDDEVEVLDRNGARCTLSLPPQTQADDTRYFNLGDFTCR